MSALHVVAADGNELSDYLHYLYDGLDGYVAAATKDLNDLDQNGNPKFKRESFVWPEQKQVLIDWIKSETPHREVYVAPAIFNAASGRKEDFKATNVVWVELDGNVPSESQLNGIPTPTLRVQSSSADHEHWYWRLDEVITSAPLVESINRSLTYQLGADASGWDANQILRPPATHNHKRDQPVHINFRTDERVRVVNFETVPAAPTQVVDLDVNDIPDVTDVVLMHAWPKDAIDLYRSNVSGPGERSSMLMRLGYYLAEMGLSDLEMFSVLRNADDRWGKFKDRTDRNKRLSDLISVARVKYPSEVQIGEAIPLFGALSFLKTEIKIEWVIPGLLQEQGYMLLTGPSGVGKTQFSLRFAIAMALGRNFLGYEISRPRRILIWSMEMGHADLKYFAAQMFADLTDEDMQVLEQNLIISPIGEAFYLDKEDQQGKLRAIVKEFNIEGVFLDSVGSTSSNSVSDEVTAKAVTDFNDRLRNETGAFTWWIHHNRKATGDNKKPNKLADVYGSQYWVNRATTVYCLWPAGGSNIEVIPLKKRLSALEDPWMIQRFGHLDFARKESNVVLKTSIELDLTDEAPPMMQGF